MAEYAYCRVSTKDQNLERQLLAMKIRNIPEKNIFCEKESGKDFEREVYKKLKKRLRYGDNLTVMSLDRFGRNYDQILKEWRDLTEAGVGIVVVDMPLLNTARDYDLTGRLIADIVLQLLAYVAQTERERILDRQRQGIDAAKVRGVRFGAPRSLCRRTGTRCSTGCGAGRSSRPRPRSCWGSRGHRSTICCGGKDGRPRMTGPCGRSFGRWLGRADPGRRRGKDEHTNQANNVCIALHNYCVMFGRLSAKPNE